MVFSSSSGKFSLQQITFTSEENCWATRSDVLEEGWEVKKVKFSVKFLQKEFEHVSLRIFFMGRKSWRKCFFCYEKLCWISFRRKMFLSDFLPTKEFLPKQVQIPFWKTFCKTSLSSLFRKGFQERILMEFLGFSFFFGLRVWFDLNWLFRSFDKFFSGFLFEFFRLFSLKTRTNCWFSNRDLVFTNEVVTLFSFCSRVVLLRNLVSLSTRLFVAWLPGSLVKNLGIKGNGSRGNFATTFLLINCCHLQCRCCCSRPCGLQVCCFDAWRANNETDRKRPFLMLRIKSR